MATSDTLSWPSKNGMIAIIDGTVSSTSKKWLDIEITNRWPVFSIGRQGTLLRPGEEPIDLVGYDHLSVPPDLRLHISGRKPRIMFNAEPAWAVREGVSPFLHWFSCIGKTIAMADSLTGGKKREWHQAALFSPFPDLQFVPTRDRAVLDFFLHRLDASFDAISPPLAIQGMRLAYDRSACTIGPFPLGGLYRKTKLDLPLGFTLRMGFIAMEPGHGVCVYVPLAVRQEPSERTHPEGETP